MLAAPTQLQEMRVHELLERAGITKRQLDYYIKRRAVSPPVGQTVSARYTGKHLDQILRIKDLLKKGHTVKEIAEAYAENVPEGRAEKTPSSVQREVAEKLIVHKLTPGIRIVVNEELHPTEVALLKELLKLGKLSKERRLKLLRETISCGDKVLNQENDVRRRTIASRR